VRAIQIARQCGLHVPVDLSVVGFADLEIARYSDPALTTVREPFEEVGKAAFQLMQEEIENPRKPSFRAEISRQVAAPLIVRESTAKPGTAR